MNPLKVFLSGSVLFLASATLGTATTVELASVRTQFDVTESYLTPPILEPKSSMMIGLSYNSPTESLVMNCLGCDRPLTGVETTDFLASDSGFGPITEMLTNGVNDVLHSYFAAFYGDTPPDSGSGIGFLEADIFGPGIDLSGHEISFVRRRVSDVVFAYSIDDECLPKPVESSCAVGKWENFRYSADVIWEFWGTESPSTSAPEPRSDLPLAIALRY